MGWEELLPPEEPACQCSPPMLIAGQAGYGSTWRCDECERLYVLKAIPSQYVRGEYPAWRPAPS